MIAEIILIPDGLGLDAAKASAQYVARGLSSIGMRVREQITVCPDKTQFQQAVASALSRSNVLVTLGGMGPESNYLAKTVLSRGLGLPLEENPGAVSGLKEYCRRNAETFNDEDFALAMLPRGATAFPGSCGKIPGCVISSTKQHIIMLPETQAEIAPMFHKYVSPYLGGSASTTVTRTIRTYGMREEEVAQALGDILNRTNPAVTTQKDENEVLVRVSAHAANPQQAAAMCTPTLQDIVDRLGDAAYGLDVDSMQAAVIGKLQKKELDLAIAEGGTGGMLTRVISETPGGQDILRYTVSIDTTEVKEQKLGISRKELKKAGNVSEYAAVAAANAAREKAGTAIGVCVLANTGGEKSRACPVGVVYIAVCTANHVYAKKLVVGDGDADADVIIDAALSRALNMTRLTLDYLPKAYTAAIPLGEALAGRGVTDLDDYEDFDTGEAEPDSPKGGFFSNFVIRKADTRGVKVRKFFFILAVLVFLGSAGYVGLHYYNGYVAKKQAAELASMFEFGDMGDVEVSPDYPKDYSLRFAGLWNINPDVAAFISIPETGVKYPVVKAGDNDYYMRRDFYGNSNRYGVPFMDYRVDLRKPSDNIVIYGHNMMDGQIFGELISYKDLDYYRQHPTINCFTVYNDMADETVYKVFSVFITNAYENQGHVFAYHDFIDAKSSAEFTNFISEVTNRSLINTTVDVRKGDKLLTLSTCTYEFQDARLVVVARALRKGESEEVNADEATMNPAPLMPDVWYKTFGGSRPPDEELAVQPTALGQSGMLFSITPLVSRGESDAELAKEAESRAESRREQSRLDDESRLEEMSEAVSDAVAESEAEASRLASEAEASRLASEAAKAESEAAAKAASEAEASRIASEAEASRLASEAAEKAASEAAASKAAAEAAASKAAAEKAAAAKAEAEEESSVTVRDVSDMDTTISVSSGGRVYRNVDEIDIIPRIVQAEVGSSFDIEAIKAQAVAAYTFIRNANASGSVPGVVMASKADQKVTDAVYEVLGEAIYYKNREAFTPYHAISAGQTTSSKDVWGGSYPYLVSVDSEVDRDAAYYKVRTSMSRSKVESLIRQKLGIEVSGDPEDWFEVISYADGDYNGKMSVCGETKSKVTGSTITGRLLRETVLNLRSACFEVEYDSGGDTFYFTSYGYGHGVGMSQTGANFYAKQGWSYIEILEHYYPGTTVM